MTTNKEIITALTLEEMFANECRIINLRYEYPGYTGDELFGIATSLSEDELICKYNKLLSSYIPYVLLPTSYGEVRDCFKRNENKHYMRAIRTFSIFDMSDEFEEHHPEITTRATDEIFLEQEMCQSIYNAIATLTDIQKRRIIKYYFNGQSLREIAKDEGVSFSKIKKSIDIALEKIKNFLN